MKDQTQAQLTSLTEMRETLLKLRASLKNKINNVLFAHGSNLENEALSSDKKLNEILAAIKFDPIIRIRLKVIVEQIRSLNQSIAELETIAGEGSELGHKALVRCALMAQRYSPNLMRRYERIPAAQWGLRWPAASCDKLRVDITSRELDIEKDFCTFRTFLVLHNWLNATCAELADRLGLHNSPAIWRERIGLAKRFPRSPLPEFISAEL
jgi:hypothetical protein